VTVYLDASFVVSLFVTDVHTERADRWIADLKEEAIVSELCALEFAASVSRRVRMGRMTVRAAEEALTDFDDWRGRSTFSLPIDEADTGLAASLVRDFATKLAAADALHLAAAINARARLVTFDSRLITAARMRNAAVDELE
jgi:predicted nucleic acid-binding protein